MFLFPFLSEEEGDVSFRRVVVDTARTHTTSAIRSMHSAALKDLVLGTSSI